MVSTVEFDPARLRLARHLRGLRAHQLASAVELTPGAISQYESGHCRPSAGTLARLSLALGLSPAFFSSGSTAPSQRGAAHFRSVRSCTQVERHRAIAHAALASEVAHVLERRVRFPPMGIPCLTVSEEPTRDEIEEAATATRSIFGLAEGPAPNVVRLLEL